MESPTALLELAGLNTGEAIREWLRIVGEGNPYAFYKLFRQVKPSTSYDSIRRYFWILKEIGLIESVRFEEAAPKQFRKHFYKLVPERIEDPAWWAPQTYFYPDTGLGSSGYRALAEKGLKPRGGRRRMVPFVARPTPTPVKPKKPPVKKKKVRKKKVPKVLKRKPRVKEEKPRKERFVMVKSKAEHDKRIGKGWTFVKMIDGNYLMKPPD